MQQGTLAPQAAGTIHTDFEKGFVCAEVMAYSDFIEAGSETACAAAGHKHQKGKTYEVIDGDIIFFKVRITPAASCAVVWQRAWLRPLSCADSCC